MEYLVDSIPIKRLSIADIGLGIAICFLIERPVDALTVRMEFADATTFVKRGNKDLQQEKDSLSRQGH